LRPAVRSFISDSCKPFDAAKIALVDGHDPIAPGLHGQRAQHVIVRIEKLRPPQVKDIVRAGHAPEVDAEPGQ
jgi:hypothetical protein